MEKTARRNWGSLPGVAALIGALAGLSGGEAMAEPVPPHGVVAAHIQVEQLGFENDPSNVLFTVGPVVGDFRVRESANRGDYDVQIGPELADDVETGVLITSVAEIGRDNFDPVYPGINYATSHIDYSRSGLNMGGYFIPVALTWPNANSTAVVEYNMNVTAAWFPNDQWIGGFVRNADGANGGPNDLMSGSPALQLGTHFIDHGGGRSTVDLTPLGIHSQTDGVLLVTGAKNEDNYALTQANADGTWTILSKDNGTDGASTEQDPVAFVYVPKTNSLVVSGKFLGNGEVALFSGETPAFNITPMGEGRWELKIPGHLPGDGVLIVSPEGGLAMNRDNVVSHQVNETEDGWIIESSDLPATFPLAETPGEEPVASFAFIPGARPGFTVEPTANLATSENGDAAIFSVALDTEPAADVTIAIESRNVAEGVVNPSILVFTAADWNLPQIVTVTGVDDAALDGPVSYVIALAPATSSDPRYDQLDPSDVLVTNLDNEPGISVNPASGLVVTESGGTASFTVRLNTQPAADVTFALASSDPGEGTVSPETMTFTSADWNIERTVTVTGVNDAVDDGDQEFFVYTKSATSADPAYSGKDAADVLVLNQDDDAAGVIVDFAQEIQLIEGGASATFTVVLGSEPAADVEVSLEAIGEPGQVHPSALSFNAANWHSPQVVTITPRDDLIAAGSSDFRIVTSIHTTDEVYSAIDPADVPGIILDNEPVVTIAPGRRIYGSGAAGTLVAPEGTILDPHTASYAGVSLSFKLASNSSAGDRLEVRHLGAGAGQVGVSGDSVSFEGIEVGTVSGGWGSTPLVVQFNAAASAMAAEAILRSVIYRNEDAEPFNTDRALEIRLTHPDGGAGIIQTAVRPGLLRVSEFQEGADFGAGVYTGTADAELYELNAEMAYPAGHANSRLWLDWRDPDNPNSGQILLRFDNILGDGPGQIPTNAIVVSAELILDVVDSGDGSPMHRMMIPWDAEATTWSSIGWGMFPDDFRARFAYDSQIGVENGTGSTTIGKVSVSVRPDVEAWVSGAEPNYGWVLPGWPLNLDGTGISPSEAEDISARPRLRVVWLPPGSASAASFRHGVNDYFGAMDTRIRENTPDAEYSTVTAVFVDAQVSSGGPNPEQVLLRFDDVFGEGAGQIPHGSYIEAAMLDVASVNGDAMGDGGQIFALLQPWTDVTATWNSWVDGIQTNGIEAAMTPSAIAGSPSLNPDVQGGYHSFDLTADVQGWSSGTLPNEGWMFHPWPGGGNGWGFTTAESFEERHRPRLRIYYNAPRTVQPVTLGTPAVTAAGVEVRFTGARTGTYSVWRAEAIDGEWTRIGEAFAGANGSGVYLDSNTPARGAFYRVTTP